VRDYREPWLTLEAAAEYWGCSERSIQYAITDGMPHARIFGRPKVLASEAEPWLIANGRLTRSLESEPTNSTGRHRSHGPPPDTEKGPPCQ
jgi:hypothetical protein